jgi:decaprenylphospho-beta-D-ribofuranose 2-oxidase
LIALIQIGSERGAIATGLQRSYGDSPLNSGGFTLSTLALNQIEIDTSSGIATLGAGVSIQELEIASLRSSFFPPVVPGTGFVTVGGAIAADIHGKSHHSTGSFSNSVRRLQLLYSDGSLQNLYPTGPTERHFWATVGGLGLTGVIVEVELQLRHVSSDQVDVIEVRCANIEELMHELEKSDHHFEHTVAWIDLSADFQGRGVVSKANHLSTHEFKSFKNHSSVRGVRIPKLLEKNLITPTNIRIFNEIWYKKPLKNGTASIQRYMHPLDGILDWNRLYGKNGFIQYQFVVPEDSVDIFPRILALLRKHNASSFLGVLKRFGEGNKSHLSFPMSGWTLAMDFSVDIPNLASMLNQIDQWVVESNGRVYLVKDSRLQPERVLSMYPRLREWQEIRNEMDPMGLWRSNQARRLSLC